MVALLTAIIDLFELYVIAGTTFLGLIVTNILILTAGFLLIPFFIEFKK